MVFVCVDFDLIKRKSLPCTSTATLGLPSVRSKQSARLSLLVLWFIRAEGSGLIASTLARSLSHHGLVVLTSLVDLVCRIPRLPSWGCAD